MHSHMVNVKLDYGFKKRWLFTFLMMDSHHHDKCYPSWKVLKVVMFPFKVLNVHIVAPLFFASLAPPLHDSSLGWCFGISSFLSKMFFLDGFFVTHFASLWCSLDLVILDVVLVVALLFFTLVFLHHFFWCYYSHDIIHVVHIAFHC